MKQISLPGSIVSRYGWWGVDALVERGDFDVLVVSRHIAITV